MMRYRYSENGKKLTQFYEGRESKAYKDSVGNWTIGIGHTLNVKEGDVISEDKIDELFYKDIMVCEEELNKLGLKITQQQFDALIDFIFQFGFSKFYSSTLLKKVKVYNLNPEIRFEFQRWIHGENEKHEMVEIEQLKRRRQSEIDMYFTGNLILYDHENK